MLRRLLVLVLSLPALLAGAFGVALGRVPDHTLVERGMGLVDRLAGLAGVDPLGVEAHLTGPIGWALLGVGGFLLFVALNPGRSERSEEKAPARREPPAPSRTPKPRAKAKGAKPEKKKDAAPAPAAATTAGVSGKVAKKLLKEAQALAKEGNLVEAGETCLAGDLYDEAVAYFEQAEEWVRAAEVRHDQNRFSDAVQLYLKAGQYESAGTVLTSQGRHEDAAKCYAKAGRMTVAAEMYEKSGRFSKAAECYTQCEFHRHAAQAYLKAHDYGAAARSLEQAYNEESTRAGVGGGAGKEKELRQLVLQAGKLYEEAGEHEASVRILERGECLVPAAELALRQQQFAKAAELFERGGEPERAARVLQELGEDQAAARILGEHLRDRGDPAEAAEQLQRAGDFLAAGDLFRSIERYGDAAECYEREGDSGQAAEMFRLSGDFARAAGHYEKVGQYEHAAECYGESGDEAARAGALVRAGRFLEAGQVHKSAGRLDEAIAALQQAPSESYEYAAASALLGEIFVEKGQPGLAVAKLAQAIGDAEVSASNVDAYYRLGTVYEQDAQFPQAADVYQRILAFDFHYADAGERLEAARQRAGQSAPPTQDPNGATATVVGGAAAAGARPTRYRIEGELGRGGMGIVYKARDTVLDRPVALKVLPDALQENPQALANFLREAKSAARLNHPNIVTVYDAGEEAGRYYIAMEYVDGTTLKAIVQKRGAIAPASVLHVLLQMCDGLGYAHEQHVVHRDVKTANTMWTRDKKAKIMDFGLAKVIEEVRNHTTLVSGTPYYMSPEQTLGKNIDHRTDIYSLGVAVFELSTGTLPFRDGNVPYHHVHTAPPDPREFNPKLPKLLAGIINKCLQKKPEDRFQATAEISGLVRRAMAQRSEG